MNVFKRLNRWIVVACLALALGLGVAVAHQSVNTPTASATIKYVYVAKTTKHNVRACDEFNGRGACQTMRGGQWFALGNGVASIQVDRGCELWMHGAREAKRKNHDWWYNAWSKKGKATIRLSNCR